MPAKYQAIDDSHILTLGRGLVAGDISRIELADQVGNWLLPRDSMPSRVCPESTPC